MKRFYTINENNQEEFDIDWFNEALEEGSITETDWHEVVLELTKHNKQFIKL